ncbi:MAG: hypothetical protein HC840_01285 [Leptolyngbyaceae cyanobacterium RM2_2_4]|nr:hypothetical protein [Leptolyngbyaceae cyanobacterium RM2_2_4]
MRLDIREELTNTEFFHNLIYKKEIVIDNSTFIQLDACFAKGIMGGLLKKVQAGGEVHLSFGGCVHAALEAKFKGASLKEQIRSAEEHPDFKNLSPHDKVKTPAKLRELLAAYQVHTDTTPDFEILSCCGEICVEQSFRLPLGTIFDGECSVYWEGKIDMFCKYLGQIWIGDHKTTQVMGEKYIDSYLRSSQILGYFWAAHALIELGLNALQDSHENVYDLTKKPFHGVLINALCIRSKGFEFKPHPIPLSLLRIEEWREETLLRLEHFVVQLEKYMDTGIAVPTREHCVTKYGRCPFFDVCEMPESKRKGMLTSPLFKTSTWSPHD